MLKLERIFKTKEINILIKNQEKRFTAPLVKAFGAALAIHLLFFTLFQITTISYRGSTTLLPPTLVVAESPIPHVATVASTQLNEAINKRIPIRPPLEPKVATTIDTFTKVTASNLQKYPVESVENDFLIPVSLSLQTANLPPIRLFVSRDLKNQLIQKELPQTLPKLPQKALDLESVRSVFEVAIDPNDGRVFWYETVESTLIIPLNILAETLVKTLEFAKNPNGTITKGLVEIHFNLKK